jgi:hypothetical protein
MNAASHQKQKSFLPEEHFKSIDAKPYIDTSIQKKRLIFPYLLCVEFYRRSIREMLNTHFTGRSPSK